MEWDLDLVFCRAICNITLCLINALLFTIGLDECGKETPHISLEGNVLSRRLERLQKIVHVLICCGKMGVDLRWMCSENGRCSQWGTCWGDGENGENEKKDITDCIVKPMVALSPTLGGYFRFCYS